MQITSRNVRKDTFLNSTSQGGHPFRDLRGETSASFNAMGTEINHSRGTLLFAEGEAPQCVFIVHSGRIKLSVTSRDGRTMIVRIAEKGQVLGLNAALTASEHEVSAEALEPCRVTAIRTKEFLRFLEKYPEAAKGTMSCVLKEYQVVFSGLCRLGLQGTVAGRLANLLLDWLKKHGQAGRVKPHVTMPLTHGEIAAMTGTSRETVNRVLQSFQREKVISIKGASVTVLRPQALEQLAV